MAEEFPIGNYYLETPLYFCNILFSSFHFFPFELMWSRERVCGHHFSHCRTVSSASTNFLQESKQNEHGGDIGSESRIIALKLLSFLLTHFVCYVGLYFRFPYVGWYREIGFFYSFPKLPKRLVHTLRKWIIRTRSRQDERQYPNFLFYFLKVVEHAILYKRTELNDVFSSIICFFAVFSERHSIIFHFSYFLNTSTLIV